MPIYSYECKSCGKVFEHMIGVSMEEDPLECPGCNSTKLIKKFSSFSVGKTKVSQRGDSCSKCCNRERCR